MIPASDTKRVATRAQMRVQGAADEAETVFRRQAFGEGIAVEGDTAAVAGGPDGQVWVHGRRSSPFHSALLDVWLERWSGWRAVAERGTVYATNDPYIGGSSLQDLRMVAPLRHEGRLAGFVALCGRLDDVGGQAAWGIGSNSADVFEEGVRVLPAVAARGWVLDPSWCEMISANSRFPVSVKGDLQAMVDGLRAGVARLEALLARIGLPALESSSLELAGRAEAAGTAMLAAMKPGSYLCRERLDGNEPGTPGPRIVCRVEVGADGLVFDFAGSDPSTQGALNAPPDAVKAACAAAWAHLFPNAPRHQAVRSRFAVRVPDGSLLDARFPSAVGGATSVVIPRIMAAFLEAASSAAPGHCQAAGAAGSGLVLLQGFYEGSPYFLRLNVGGGGGASGRGDGLSNGDMGAHHTWFPSVEYLERHYPIRVVEYSLREHSGGPGRYRGGLGACLEVELEGPSRLNLLLDRSYRGAGGQHRGARGGRTRVSLRRGDKWETPSTRAGGVILEAGDRLRLETPGGGGYGHPCERSIRLASKELREGLCSRREAALDYGVLFRSGAGLDFDSAKTFRLRSYRLTVADVEPILDEIDELE